jgi:hypothetical protein
MKRKLQFAGWLMALGVCAALAMPSFAQGPRANGAQNRQDNKPPKQQSQAPRQHPPRQQPRQEQRQQRQQQQEARRTQNERRNYGGNRPPNSNVNRAETTRRPNVNPNRPPSAYTLPPPKKFSELNPQEKKKVVDSYNKQRNLTPAQRQQIDERIRKWNQLTPEQQNHVRNEVMPKWRQLPPQRQNAIQQRLGVLQNMPESARNQHLNDPNFTRGMSEEDKAMLRDLSHMHVGAPDPPSE